MFFRQVLHEDLGCASYVVADGGEAAVVDPKWEIEEYLDLAREHDFQIRHVLETHNHADHLCGGAGMSEKPGSTLGFERRFNPLLRIEEEDEFVRELTGNLAPQPPNFERIVELNRGPLVTEPATLSPLAATRAHELLADGATLVDGRDPREFDALHVPGSISVTQTHTGVGTRAAWVLEPDAEIVVLAASDDDARTLARQLEAVGFRSLRGFVAGGIAAWQAADLPTASTPAIDPEGLAERLRSGDVTLLDVREDDEWEEGHVEGSIHVPYHELRDGPPAGLPRDQTLAVACSAGNRSSLAVSLLGRGGVDDVVHVADGGIEDLEALGVELEHG